MLQRLQKQILCGPLARRSPWLDPLTRARGLALLCACSVSLTVFGQSDPQVDARGGYRRVAGGSLLGSPQEAIGQEAGGQSPGGQSPGGQAPAGQGRVQTASGSANWPDVNPARLEFRLDNDVSSELARGALQRPFVDLERVSFQDLESARLIAVVGEEPVLVADVQAMFAEQLDQFRDRISAWELEEARSRWLRQAVPTYVRTKAMAQRFVRDSVGNVPAKDRVEAKKRVAPKAAQMFHEQIVPQLFKHYGVDNELDLDAEMRRRGMSLVSQRQLTIDMALAQQAINQNVNEKPEIPFQELWQAYESDIERWQRPARARWRQMSVHFERFPSRQAAEVAIAAMGNEVLFGGTPFEAVARQQSQDFRADRGGEYDWINAGSLRSKPLEKTIFSIPLGHLSQIVEDERGLHIVEVLERQEAYQVSFEQAQVELRAELVAKKKEILMEEFAEQVMQQTRIWSMWPEDIPGARPLSEAVWVEGYQP